MNILEFKKKSQTSSKIQGSNLVSEIPSGVSAIGIDLGTTNSVVSIYVNGQEHPTTLAYEGSYLIPSIIYYDEEKSETIVGLNAKRFLDNEAAEVIRSTKRSMGKKNSSFSSHGKVFRAEDVAILVLKYIVNHPTLQKEKEQFGGIWAVITVPAHFDDAARTATIEAAESAGIHVLRIINEPTAAALAYSMIHENEKHSIENLAVFDFGGGTFDVSVVEKNELTFNVLSSEGDVNLGGDDVDEVVAEYFLTKVHPPFVSRRTKKDSELYRKISLHAQEAKKLLQTEASVHICNDDLDGKGSSLDVTLDRTDFEQMIQPILEKTIYLTESAIQSAKKSPKNISRILLVGGSTRLQLARIMLSDYFPCQVDARLEPDIAVSWGASLQAAIILGIQVETILVDVCTHSLGIGVVESSESAQENVRLTAKKYGLSYPLSEDELHKKLGNKIDEFNLEIQSLLRVAPILYRNSALPARKSEFFNTVYHNQQAVHVVVVQGEGELVGENRLIGTFVFKLQLPCPKGTRCEIQLTYDVNGMVQVFARQQGTSNEGMAHFDSRTGKVEGWSNAKESEQPVPSESKEVQTQTVEKIEASKESNKVISIQFGGRSNSEKQEELSNNRSLDEISGLNAILVRAKRVLLKLNEDSEEFKVIYHHAKEYGTLLESAKDNSVEDEVIELLEEKLLSHLEGK